MRITILEDYQHAVRKLDCFKFLDGHDVQILKQSYSDPKLLAEKLSDTDALVLLRGRTKITADLLAQLPKMKLISFREYYSFFGGIHNICKYRS